MTRIVPTQIVETIDRLFTGISKGAGTAALSAERIYHLQGLVSLLRQLPHDLLIVDAREFADLTVATAAIELAISRWSNIRDQLFIPLVSGEDVIHTIRRVLDKCPDESRPAATADLPFIRDEHIRESIRSDVAAANAALQNAEWKAATVLGGAAIETLLHWKLSPPQTTQSKRDEAARALSTKPPADFDKWGLLDFISVSKKLGVIGEITFKQADTARDYRNLIHPGRSARTRQVCNRATALAVISGLEHVINDLGG